VAADMTDQVAAGSAPRDAQEGRADLQSALELADAVWRRGPLSVAFDDPELRRAVAIAVAAGARAQRLARAILALYDADLVHEAGVVFRAFVELYITTLWLLHGDIVANAERLAYDDNRGRIAVDDRKPPGVRVLSPEMRQRIERSMATTVAKFGSKDAAKPPSVEERAKQVKAQDVIYDMVYRYESAAGTHSQLLALQQFVTPGDDGTLTIHLDPQHEGERRLGPVAGMLLHLLMAISRAVPDLGGADAFSAAGKGLVGRAKMGEA
jgi:hypothetical protein